MSGTPILPVSPTAAASPTSAASPPPSPTAADGLVPAYLNLVPGGVAYPGIGGGGSDQGVAGSNSAASVAQAAVQKHCHKLSLTGDPTQGGGVGGNGRRTVAADLIARAVDCDEVLRAAAALSFEQSNGSADGPSEMDHGQPQQPAIFLPSLSALAESAFGGLTGVPPTLVRKWADAMTMSYLDDDAEVRAILMNGESGSSSGADGGCISNLPSLLRALHSHYVAKASGPGGTGDAAGPSARPCGYVFRKGDIAWNCRTCQADSTCVLCDQCFHESDHTGHEVFFHRTNPGGCCDCGDIEAWKAEGCCDRHRPRFPVANECIVADGASAEEADSAPDPDHEAVRAADRSREETAHAIRALLPPRLAAALGVVIGNAVQSILRTMDGSAIGSDLVQWERHWSEQARRFRDGCTTDEEYIVRSTAAGGDVHWVNSPDGTVWNAFPPRFRLQLRLHNDDVHTFDEVIDALYSPSQNSRRRTGATADETDISNGLVAHRSDAEDMTHHVDSDGQVTVRSYATMAGAKAGYSRLKSRGLHCSVVSTPHVVAEKRSRELLLWLADLCSAHPAVGGMVVHALVDVDDAGAGSTIGGVRMWREGRFVPCWALTEDPSLPWARAFPPHLDSSFLSREEAQRLHAFGFGTQEGSSIHPSDFAERTGADPNYYAAIPHNRLPSERYHKSPHALWGTMVLPPDIGGQSSDASVDNVHPLLVAARSNTLVAQPKLLEKVLIIDTDMRKQQASEQLTTAMHPHRLPGLSIISGIGLVDTVDGDISDSSSQSPMPAQWSQILSTASFATPPSPLLLFLLHDPYPTASIRKAMHSLFLSLFVDARFKSRFAAALGGVAYRPLSTLFCSGVGTESDSPLAMSVQIFTAGSLVRALGNSSSVAKLLCSDSEDLDSAAMARNVKSIPVAHNVVRCIQTNLLGSTQEVERALQNVNNGETVDSSGAGLIVNPALIYKAGEHPMATLLPAAPDDGFLDSRSTKHKRLPHLLRDLEYIFETPSTAMRLLLTAAATASTSDAHHMPLSDIPHIDPSTYLTFPTIWARLLRLGQGMDPQKRLISGGHVEYEKNRWLEAFGLSLNLAGAYDALAESPAMTDSNIENIRRGMGNLISSLLKEIKLWLYREGMLETGEPISSSASEDLGQQEALQRSTLHLNSTQMGITSEDGLSSNGAIGSTPAVATIALSCATSVKMTEAQLELLELALKREAEPGASSKGSTVRAAVMGDSLRCPHTPLNGDCISFHLPLHRALARSIRSICSVTVSYTQRDADPRGWWKLPVLDDEASDVKKLPHALASLIRPTIRSSNCRVVWAAGPECSSPEAHTRRSRSRFVSASIAAAKVIHSLCDHPLRCLVASQQIERHLWARNGSAAAGMALNYGSMPLCRSFRDLDLALVQFSAAGLSVGLGARRVFSLMLSRFSLDGYLCDLERRGGGFSPTGSIGSGGSPRRASSAWVNPPRMQDPDHAVALMECFFSTICVLVTELPSPAPTSSTDITALRCNMKRELLHALAAEPRSHSEAMAAVSGAVTRRDDFDGGDADSATSFRAIFAQVLKEVGNVKSLGSRSTGAPSYELKAEVSDEYDPNFFHLRRHEHQHAMDTISRLRRHKVSPPGPPGSPRGGGYAKCLPLVTPPPSAHPRFIACRLLLHLPAIDGSVRRGLMFALFGGKWLPPDEPLSEMDSDGDFFPAKGPGENAMDVISPTMSTESTYRAGSPPRRSYVRSPSSSKRSKRSSEQAEHFSTETVAASSISLLEILQILTLQAHTLEECASLHLSHALDVESRDLSSGLSLNSYLNRLVHMPERLEDIWALRKAPNGPLPSKGSGANRGSILGLLIALYENRADNSSGNQGGDRDEGNGGARSLAADGLKWLLRLVDSVADGAPSVGAASERASSGARHRSTTTLLIDTSTSESIIDPNIRDLVSGMLANLADLWPKEETKNGSGTGEAGGMSAKAREARKAAQRRAMERMMKAQSSFAASLNGDTSNDVAAVDAEDDEEANLCIICRCDDKDGEMGPLGFLGHVQRTRALQLRATSEASHSVESDENMLHRTFRVIGDRGCQLRASEAMNSKAIACLPIGSIVTVLESKVSPKYDLLSRRVLVRHVDAASNSTTEGWASLQSSQGYIILSPLSTLCYTNSRWGCTRPIVLQCGHAAHLRCVEAHCLSLHQRAAGDQPYDGRFAANIDDGEFLCPLCKQLSNILVPDIGNCGASRASSSVSSPLSSDGSGRFTPPQATVLSPSTNSISSIRNLLCTSSHTDYEGATEDDDKMTTSLKQFGAHLYTAMQIPWDKSSPVNRRQQKNWHPALMRWDFEEDNDDYTFSNSDGNEPCVGDILRMLRELHVAWAAVGHTSAATEAAFRGVDGVEDPWSDYSKSTRDSNPDVLSLSRTVTATSGLLEVLSYELGQKLGGDTYKARKMTVTLIGGLLADILEGRFWTVGAMPSSPQSAKQQSIFGQWQSITGLLASTPCHVARDGMLAQRHEARATAVAMWTTKGFGFPPAGKKDQEAPAISTSTPSDSTLPSSAAAVTSEESEGGAEGTGIEIRERSPDVPTPLAVHRVCADQETKKSLDSSWGTMDPFKASEPISIKKDNIEVQLSSGTQTFDPSLPFRPAVASAYLYIPLLAWDMSTFAGAIYSSMLVNKEAGSQASNDDLLHASRLMLIGRLIQILVSPGGFDPLREIDSGDLEAVMAKDEFEKHWQKEDILREAKSLAELLKYCRSIASPGSNQQGIEVATEAEAAQLLHNVGLAILPFARTSVLLLRSSASILRQREKKDRREKKSKTEKPTATENIFSTLLENSETMAFEDGFRILKSIGAPLPSELMKDISSHDVSGSPSSWFALIKRWLSSVRGFEAYHGSRGKGLVFDPLSGAWQQSAQQTEATDTSGSNEKESKRFIVQEHISRSGSTDVSTEGTMGVEIAVAPENEGGDNGIPYNGSMEMEDAIDPTERGDNFMNQGDDDSESLGSDVNVDMLDIDFDEELEEMEAVEMPGQMDPGGGGNNLASAYTLNEMSGDISDDDRSYNSSESDPVGVLLDRRFANLETSAVIPFQPSMLGVEGVGPGPRGTPFDFSVASSVMSDRSHLGMVHRVGSAGSGFIRLPHSFIELYSLVNRVKGRETSGSAAMDDADDGSSAETAICLLTGAIISAGSSRRQYSRSYRPPGACTLHSRRIGSGVGIYFLVQKCTVLLVHNNKSAYSASLFVDEHGEEDPGLRRGRPLFMKEERYAALETLWRQHGIPREVAQIRSTADRVIRDNWY